jgi:hypothetical protein
MGRSAFRKMVSCVLLFLFPSALFAADSSPAMLYSNGPTWVNGAHVPRASSAIFTGDILQTRVDSQANINAAGTSVTVLGDSIVRYEGSDVAIEHGGVTVSTSKGMSTTAGDVKISPASSAWTEFNVVDVDGTVRISARKGDLTVSDGKEVFTLAQGQDTTRPETSDNSDQNNLSGKKKKRAGEGATPAAAGGILNSPWAIGIGGAAIIGVTTWVLVLSPNPASPASP